MALQTSGPISLNDIHIEAGGSSGTSVSLNDADVRGLISKASGDTSSFNEFYGASSSLFTGPATTLGTIFSTEVTATAHLGNGAAFLYQAGPTGGGTIQFQQTAYFRDTNTTSERNAYRANFGPWTSQTNGVDDYMFTAVFKTVAPNAVDNSDLLSVNVWYVPITQVAIPPGGTFNLNTHPVMCATPTLANQPPNKGFNSVKYTITGNTSGATRTITAPASYFSTYFSDSCYYGSWQWLPPKGYLINTANPEVTGSGTFVNETYTGQLTLL